MNTTGGILLVDKPAGVTSFGVVNQVRKTLMASFPELAARRAVRGGPRPPRFKCGHAGTLDPLATGLLVVLIGKGSRLSPFLMGLDKSYLATVRFGAETDTLDREGVVTATAPPPASSESVAACLADFRGDIMQVPPLISALKQNGQALYKKVRSGQAYDEPEARPVSIRRLELVGVRWAEVDPQTPSEAVYEVDVLVECSSGTYVRSLARDIAVAAGSLGHINALRRLEIGPFTVADSLTGVMVLEGPELAAAMRPLAEALPDVPLLNLEADEAERMSLGGQPESSWVARLDQSPAIYGKAGRIFRMVDPGGALVAIGRLEEGTGEPRTAAVITGKG